MDGALLAAEHGHDVVEDLGVEVFQEQGIELAHLVQAVELEDGAGGVAASDHVELLDVVQVDVLPQLIRRRRVVVDGVQQRHVGLGKGAVEVDLADHVPGVRTSDGHAGDAVVSAGLDAPLCRGAFGVLHGVVGLPHVGLEGVLREVVVRGADVGVAEAIFHALDGGAVVARGVVGVHDDGDAELVLKVEEVLFLVADNHGDVGNACSQQLLDLALDEHFAAHLQQALGLFVGNGGEPGREARGQDDGVFHAIGLECCCAYFCGIPVRDETGRGERFRCAVHAAEREPRGLDDFTLGAARVQDDFPQNQKFVLAERQDMTSILRISQW